MAKYILDLILLLILLVSIVLFVIAWKNNVEPISHKNKKKINDTFRFYEDKPYNNQNINCDKIFFDRKYITQEGFLKQKEEILKKKFPQ